MIAVPPNLFRLRSRHAVILVVFLAVVAGILVPVARVIGRLEWLSPWLLLFVAAPWLLGLLVLLIERKSPVKFWAAPLMVSLSAPALLLWLNSALVQGWIRMPSVSTLLAMLLINVLLIARFTFFLRDMCPRCCPECDTRSMIPLRSLWGANRRTRTTFYCTSCGVQYWRTIAGVWKEERRRTWVDLSRLAASSRVNKESKPFDTGARGIAPVIRNGGRPGVPPAGTAATSDSAEMATVPAGSAEWPVW
jgi:hypothetical protein